MHGPDRSRLRVSGGDEKGFAINVSGHRVGQDTEPNTCHHHQFFINSAIQMASKTSDSAAQKEGRILVTIEALKNNKVKSLRAASKAYNISLATLSDRLYSRLSRVDLTPNSRRLNSTKESTLLDWIISVDN